MLLVLNAASQLLIRAWKVLIIVFEITKEGNEVIWQLENVASEVVPQFAPAPLFNAPAFAKVVIVVASTAQRKAVWMNYMLMIWANNG